MDKAGSSRSPLPLSSPQPRASRKLVSVRRVSRVEPIPRSNRIAVHVDGWTVLVVRRMGHPRYQPGDLVVYFEIDCFLPKSGLRFWGFMIPDPTLETFKGQQGYRLKSQWYEGHLSQGLILPLAEFPEIAVPYDKQVTAVGREAATDELLSRSFAALLGVDKWEFAARVDDLPGGSLGRPPGFLYMPGWSRIQDVEEFMFAPEKRDTVVWQISEKLDGMTMLVYKIDRGSIWAKGMPPLPADCPSSMQDDGSRYGVCNRREDMIDREDNAYWRAARESGVLEKIRQLDLKNVAVQGEFCGSSVEGNTMQYPEGKHEFVVFAIWDIDRRKYMPPKDVLKLCNELGIKHTPVIGYSTLRSYARNTEELLTKAEGTGQFGGVREGLVFKSLDGRVQFKVISNKWLGITGK